MGCAIGFSSPEVLRFLLLVRGWALRFVLRDLYARWIGTGALFAALSRGMTLVRDVPAVAQTNARQISRTGAPPWPTKTYDVVVADPPWSYTGAQDKWAAAAKQYRTQPDDWIAGLDVAGLLTRRGVLFLWATCPRLDAGMSMVGRWGLTYRGVAFVWIKTKKSEPLVPIGAQGVRPSTVKPTTELVLVASKVAEGRPMPLADEAVRQVVLAPKSAHSEKPEAVQERIEAMYPTASKIELFARRRRPGWDAWGDQVPLDGASGYGVGAGVAP